MGPPRLFALPRAPPPSPARSVRREVRRGGYPSPREAPRLLRLQFYILRRLSASLLLVVLVVSTILFVGQTVRFLETMPDVGLEFLVGALPLFLPVTLSLTLPLAFLVTAILTYGRMADDNEVLAMRMAGIHPWAVAAPGIFAGAVVTFGCLHLQGSLAPAAVAGQDALRRNIYSQFVEIVERGATNSFSNKDFRISWDGVEGGELVDLRISRGGLPAAGTGGTQGKPGGKPGDAPGNGPAGKPGDAPQQPQTEAPDVQEIFARRAQLQRDEGGSVLVFALKDFLLVTKEGDRHRVSRGAATTFAAPAAELLSVRGTVAKPRALAYDELLFRIFRLPPGEDRRIDLERELFGRISIALAPLCFALAGIPLALLVGKGSRAAAAVLAFGIAIGFFVLWEAGNNLAGSHALPAAPAMLAGNAVLVVTGILLMRRVARR